MEPQAGGAGQDAALPRTETKRRIGGRGPSAHPFGGASGISGETVSSVGNTVTRPSVHQAQGSSIAPACRRNDFLDRLAGEQLSVGATHRQERLAQGWAHCIHQQIVSSESISRL